MDINSVELTNILLTLLGLLSGFMLWVVKSIGARIVAKFDEIDRREMKCIGRFANAKENQESHKRIYDQLDSHEHRLTVIESTIDKDDKK